MCPESSDSESRAQSSPEAHPWARGDWCCTRLQVAQACTTGASTNIIYGLALGYKSNIAPTFALALAVYIGYNMCGIFGVALSAIGILSTMCIALTIDGYGPISDNAGGLAEVGGRLQGVLGDGRCRIRMPVITL